MRYLLAAINAKYIHSNLGIYSLRRYAMERLGLCLEEYVRWQRALGGP